MRLKEYLIFIVIFTICYILFFKFLDKTRNSLFDKKILKNAYLLIDNNSYNLFSSFYGIAGIASKDIIKTIYLNYKNSSNILFNQECVKYGLNPYEFCVVILYLEYLDLINKKTINYESGIINSVSYNDANLVSKYNLYFINKYDFNTICSLAGNSSPTDLFYLNSKFLIPGVRLINSILYYVGDLNEKN